MSNMSNYILEAESISKHYSEGGVIALNSVDLKVRNGETIAIMGPSGSGKTTLLNILGLLDHPTSGRIKFNGKEIMDSKDKESLRALNIGFVFQAFNLIPVFTPIENVEIPMFESKLNKYGRRKKALELLSLVNMENRAKQMVKNLSAGEKQRVAIARALANSPKVILADEPTGNLDTKTGKTIMDLLLKINEHLSTTMIIVTHEETIASRCGRVIHIVDGIIEGNAG